MGIKKVIKDLLDESQKAYQEGDMDRVQELAQHICLVNEHQELFENLMQRVRVVGKLKAIAELQSAVDELMKIEDHYGFNESSILIEDMQQCIEFIKESLPVK